MPIYTDTICGVKKTYGYTRKKYIFFGDDEVFPTTKTFWVTHNGVKHESYKSYTEPEFDELMSLQNTVPVYMNLSVGRSMWWIYERRYYRSTDEVYEPEVMKGMILGYWDRINRREEKARARANGKEPKRATKRNPKNAKKPVVATPADQCPYQILEVSENADLNEIKKAYRQKVKGYHPDKVAGLGIELQRVAEAMTKKINHAYEILSAVHKR